MTMSCALAVKAPRISTVMLRSYPTSDETSSTMLTIDLNPVTVLGTEVSFSKDMMETDKLYRFSFDNRKYFAVKTSDTDIDIYRVKE